MSPRKEKGGPISFKHVGNEAPSKKVATSLLFQKEKVFAPWSMWRVGLREKMGIDQLKRERLKNAYFLLWPSLPASSHFGACFDLYLLHLMCVHHALTFYFLILPSTT